MRPSAGVAIRGLDQCLQLSRLLTRVCPDQDKLRQLCGEHVEERVLRNFIFDPTPGRGPIPGTPNRLRLPTLAILINFRDGIGQKPLILD